MQKLKRFLLNFAGSFIGMLIYELLKASMVGGLHPSSTLIASTVFGIVFGLIATSFATRLLHYILSGFATVLIVGGMLLLSLIPDQLNTDLSIYGWLKVFAALVSTSFFLGISSFLTSKLFAVKTKV